MNNTDIAIMFLRIADMLELQGANVFRVRAYRIAAHNLKDLAESLLERYRQDNSVLDNIPGIGKDLRSKIVEIFETGKLIYYEELNRKFPKGFLELLNIQGLGPKTLKNLGEKLNIKNIDDLEKACKTGVVQKLEGMGGKSQEKLLEAILHFKKKQGRMLLTEADEIAEYIIRYLSAAKVFKKIEKAGSLRRGCETVGDLDILAVAEDPKKAMDYFLKYPEVKKILAKGFTKTSIILKNGFQVDLRIVDPCCFGAALVYFTGSKEHNIDIRKIAKSKGYKVSEYGVFKVFPEGKDAFVAGKTESDVYEKLGMEWIPPELRESRTEIELALQGKIPKNLIAFVHIKGDLHMHSDATDGSDTIEEMIRACKRKGYKYMAITDHSKYIKIANGLDEKRLLNHCTKIRKISASIKGIDVLVGAEVDILKDGDLDFSDKILNELDIVIASIHSNFALDKEKQTKRILKALDNKCVNILAHPSGRLITTRKGLEFDRDMIFKKAAENKIALEINTHGERIDLNDMNSRRAKELGAKLVINTDAHAVGQLEFLKYGVVTARRGGLVKDDVINTYTYNKLLKFLDKK